VAYVNQSCIADIDRYDTGALSRNCQTLIQSSPALRNGCVLNFAVASYLLIEPYGEVAVLWGVC
jgi:hypothetical protein